LTARSRTFPLMTTIGGPMTVYADYGIDLAIDIVAIVLMAYGLYFRRHRRADLLLAYVTLNVGIFVAMSLLATVRVDIALGFGLFAILSIIRLRSSTVTQQEVAYYFVALVLGLVNGLNLPDRGLIVLLNVLLLVTMFAVDSRVLRNQARRLEITLDVIHPDEASLVADLERRLGGRVMYHQVNEIDYVRDVMAVDVRYRVTSERGSPQRITPHRETPPRGIPQIGAPHGVLPQRGGPPQGGPPQGGPPQGGPPQGGPPQGGPPHRGTPPHGPGGPLPTGSGR
jgi:hypothetical protein